MSGCYEAVTAVVSGAAGNQDRGRLLRGGKGIHGLGYGEAGELHQLVQGEGAGGHEFFVQGGGGARAEVPEGGGGHGGGWCWGFELCSRGWNVLGTSDQVVLLRFSVHEDELW